MQTIQFSVNDNYFKIVISILENLKQGIIEDLSITDTPEYNTNKVNNLDSFFDTFQINMSNYKFDREEANER